MKDCKRNKGKASREYAEGGNLDRSESCCTILHELKGTTPDKAEDYINGPTNELVIHKSEQSSGLQVIKRIFF